MDQGARCCSCLVHRVGPSSREERRERPPREERREKDARSEDVEKKRRTLTRRMGRALLSDNARFSPWCTRRRVVVSCLLVSFSRRTRLVSSSRRTHPGKEPPRPALRYTNGRTSAPVQVRPHKPLGSCFPSFVAGRVGGTQIKRPGFPTFYIWLWFFCLDIRHVYYVIKYVYFFALVKYVIIYKYV